MTMDTMDTMDVMGSDAAGAAGVATSTDGLYVSPTSFIQTAENRFGANVLDDLRAFVSGAPQDIDLAFEDEDSGVDDEDDEPIDEEVFLEANQWVTHLSPGLETDHAQHGFPRIATTRNNLTALSQRYNLYFAAYQDRIYVYRPRRAGPQILPPPALILYPQPSKWAERCHGVLDQRFPHQVNHLIVGNLGNFEILLLTYDDGDTIAYYTHQIVHYIKVNSGRTRSPGPSSTPHGAHPKPFFHENVGESAWGLAIHEQSRLIAVSSNLHEVTVFAFALKRPDSTSPRFSEQNMPPVHAVCGHSALALQRHFQARSRSWRIVLPLGNGGSNIPNVSFVDDEMGDAEKVAAIDITGAVVFLDIWRLGFPNARWPDAGYLREAHLAPTVRGWGVLVLPYSSFKPTKTIREALGAPGNEVIAVKKPEGGDRVWLDTTCSLYYINGFEPNPDTLFRQRNARHDYARMHASSQDYEEDELSDGWESESEADAEEGAQTTSLQPTGGHTAGIVAVSLARRTGKPWCDRSFYKGTQDFQLGQCIIPNLGEVLELDDSLDTRTQFSRLCIERKRKTKVVEFAPADSHLSKNYCLLRTSSTDVELQPLDPNTPCIECKWVLPHQHNTRTTTTTGAAPAPQPWDLHPIYSERISMLHHVPELGLVVAGSPTGRVALLVLTRAAPTRMLHMTRLRHGFRVACVLPRKGETRPDGTRVQPGCTLVGVAVSPAPRLPRLGLRLGAKGGVGGGGGGLGGGFGGGGGGKALPVTYRLILHYKDHTILAYDVRREGEEDLLVF
ncbi:uncharacterized protein B0H64DRAFT_470159 [Chaetomium fimeti]|uniref:Pyridine nucleotide-disulfide oxidoreductase family protein n=1 Tax=Chaetomium fimeti TaxID=1854472 RepID=A0AAE0HPM0_9PEZI|nr:hypothetical protein B0H64DRAFT_470159 [Chaetomium fimeti]